MRCPLGACPTQDVSMCEHSQNLHQHHVQRVGQSPFGIMHTRGIQRSLSPNKAPAGTAQWPEVLLEGWT